MVAGSSAFAAVVRSSTVSSATSAPLGVQLLDRAPVDLPDPLQLRQPPRTEATEAACASLSTITATAPESPRIHWICSGELVSYTGTVTAAGGPDREVEEDPLEAGARHQGDPVARPDAGGDESLGGGSDLGEELHRGHVGPHAGHLAAHHRGGGMLSGVAADEIRQVAVRRDLVQGRKAELAQDCCSSSGSGATALCDAPETVHDWQVLRGVSTTGLPGRYPPVLVPG